MTIACDPYGLDYEVMFKSRDVARAIAYRSVILSRESVRSKVIINWELEPSQGICEMAALNKKRRRVRSGQPLSTPKRTKLEVVGKPQSCTINVATCIQNVHVRMLDRNIRIAMGGPVF